MQQPTTTKREVTASERDYVDDNNCKMGGGDTLIYIHNEKKIALCFVVSKISSIFAADYGQKEDV